MPTATLQPSPTPGLGGTNTVNMPSQQQQQVKPPLRRAVYVHVSDLLSAYNIDHAKLEEELQRVQRGKAPPSSSSNTELGGVPSELDTSPGIKKLHPPRGGFNLCVLVGNVDLVVDKHRVDGSRVRLAEVEVGDETGRVSLRARDDQIDLLESQQGAAVVLRNCTLELFQGKHIRLAVTKWGKITPYPDHVASTPVPPSRMNEERYFSLIDLSAVARDTAVHPPASEGGTGVGGAETEGYNTGSSHGGAGGSSHGNNPAQQPRGGGRGNMNRKPSRPKPAPAMQGYTGYDAMRYQGGLHGYGYVENMDAYGGYRHRQPEVSAHLMLQQQYEMHQRQIHHQMGYAPPPPPQGPRPHEASHMAAAASGLGGFRNDMFLSPPAAAHGPALFHAPPAQPPPTQPEPTRQGERGSTTPPATTSHFPASPRMNPRAATFDPSAKGS